MNVTATGGESASGALRLRFASLRCAALSFAVALSRSVDCPCVSRH